MVILRDLVSNLKSSALIHDTWQYRAHQLVVHFINFGPNGELELIYRTDRELKLFKEKITRNIIYTKWEYGKDAVFSQRILYRGPEI